MFPNSLPVPLADESDDNRFERFSWIAQFLRRVIFWPPLPRHYFLFILIHWSSCNGH